LGSLPLQWADGPRALFPILNGGELAALYCFVFLFIAAQGSGIWSLDALRAAESSEADRSASFKATTRL
jgi:uncharacterized membrane protein YphA (DoxX/SURF4 family)